MRSKDNRGHFGLLWSVLAGYLLGGSLFLFELRSVHRLHAMRDGLAVAAAVFFIGGAVAVYLAAAVAFRIWPHQRPKRNAEHFELLKSLLSQAETLMRDWGGWSYQFEAHVGDPNTRERANEILQVVDKTAQQLMAWQEHADKFVGDLLGVDIQAQFELSANTTEPVPNWVLWSPWLSRYQEVNGRIDWLRNYLRGQLDL